MLGHSSITITLDTYSHVLPNMQEKAVEAMEDILDGEDWWSSDYKVSKMRVASSGTAATVLCIHRCDRRHVERA
jgi:hypothetical protein